MFLKIFLTGATGFIGSYVLSALLERGHEVAVLVRKESDCWRIQAMMNQLIVICGDLADTRSYQNELKAFKPQCVVHAAWFGVGNTHRNDERQILNVMHSVELLQVAADVGVQHFVGFGSQAEYGPKRKAINERASLKPTTLYGSSKLATYQLCKTLCEHDGLRFAWLRLFSTYGPKDDAHWMIPYLILKLLAGEKPRLTQGLQHWDYCHVADVADAVAHVIEHPKASGPFNIGSGSIYTIQSIVEKIRDLIEPGVSLRFGELPYRSDQVMHLEADISRITRQTGWVPKVILDEGLKDTVRWYLEHRDRYVTPSI